ncbi:cytochrome P450 2L1 [Armadillidium vulgare]|nr:cytochrome P450 2L1 [Armadillidium vulgare]
MQQYEIANNSPKHLSVRYELDDQEFIDFQNKLLDFEKLGVGMMVVDICPWLKSVVPKRLLSYLINEKQISCLSDWLKAKNWGKKNKYIEEHQETLDPNNPRDFMDDYLIEMEKQKDDPDSEMSIDDLIGCVGDLFTAGLETTSVFVRWMILFLASFTEVQKKLQKEVDEVLPNGTPFTWQDKSRICATLILGKLQSKMLQFPPIN